MDLQSLASHICKEIKRGAPSESFAHHFVQNPALVYQRVDSETFLHTAVTWGNLSAVRYFVSHHSHLIEASGRKGYTPFHLIGETLFREEGRDGGLAAQLVEIFLAAGAGLEWRNDYGHTALLALSVKANQWPGWLKAIELLLGAGADPNAQAYDGNAYLHNIGRDAGVWAPLEIINLLKKFGADLEQKNSLGKIPLELALDTSHWDHGFREEVLAALSP